MTLAFDIGVKDKNIISNIEDGKIIVLYEKIIDEIKKNMKDDEFDKPDQSYIDKYPELAEFFYARKIGSSFETKIAISVS